MITKLAISGYRSPRDVRLGLGALNVVTGANGSGRSSLYRAVRLLADIAQGRIMQSLAAEGRPAFDIVGRTGILLARDEERRAAGARHRARRR
jgi:predicted ATPase